MAAGEQTDYEPTKRLLLPGEQRIAIGVLVGESAVSRDLRAQRRSFRRAISLTTSEVVAENRQHKGDQFRRLENFRRSGSELAQMRDELGIRRVVHRRPGGR